MIDLTSWIRDLILFYPSLSYLVIFLGVAFGGEVMLLGFAFFSAAGILPLWALVLFSFFGATFMDTFWFIFVRSGFFQKINFARFRNIIFTIRDVIKKLHGENYFWILVLAKFMYGTRTPTIIYMSKTDISFKKFISYNSVAIISWLAVVVPIGFLSGLGYVYLSNTLQNLYASLGFLLLMLLFVAIGHTFIKNNLLKKRNDNRGDEEQLP